MERPEQALCEVGRFLHEEQRRPLLCRSRIPPHQPRSPNPKKSKRPVSVKQKVRTSAPSSWSHQSLHSRWDRSGSPSFDSRNDRMRKSCLATRSASSSSAAGASSLAAPEWPGCGRGRNEQAPGQHDCRSGERRETLHWANAEKCLKVETGWRWCWDCLQTADGLGPPSFRSRKTA